MQNHVRRTNKGWTRDATAAPGRWDQGSAGVSIHHLELLSKNAIRKCLTGIPGLDQITEGGLPEGRPTLV